MARRTRPATSVAWVASSSSSATLRTRSLSEIESDPFSLNRLLDAATDSLIIDDTLDPLQAAGTLRDAAAVGLETYMLPVVGVEIDDKSVVELADDAGPVLDYFRGTGPAPTTTTSTTVPD